MSFRINNWILIVFCFFSFKNFSQNKTVTLSGKALDINKQALPFVNIILTDKLTQQFIAGTISNDNGIFTISNVKKGSYLLELSYVGFLPKKIPLYVGEVSAILDVGKIQLQEDINELQGVELTYTAEAVNDKMDKKSFQVNENSSQSGGSVLQIMQNLPGVSVQDGKLLLRGNDKVIVLIDGKQTALTGFGNQSGLDNLAASSIEKIEIINNPSAKQDANGNAGVINIVYKKNSTDGLTGKAGLTTGLGSLWIRKENLPDISPQYALTPKYNPTMHLNFKKNKLNSFFNADYLYTETLNKNEFITRNYEDGTVIHQQTKRNRDTHFLTLKTGTDWAIDDKNQFSFAMVYGLEKIIDLGEQPFFNEDYSERLRLWEFLEDEVKTTIMASTSFEHQFEELGSSLNFRFNYTFHRENEKYFFTNTLSSGNSQDSFKLLSDEKVSDLEIDYVKPLKQGKLETGFKFRYREIPTNMEFYPGTDSILDVNAGGKATYKEIIPAAYTNYNYENNRIQTELGLRIEYVKLDYFVNPNHPVYQSDGYQYFQPFPSFRFSYKLNEDNRISLFYNRRIDRPNEVDIRIFPKYDDAEIIKIGNPALKPQYTNSFEVGFKKNLTQSYLYAAVFFKMINGTITRIATIENDSNLIYNVFQNAGKSYQSGVETTYSNKVSDWYSFNLNSTFYYNQINAFEVTNLYPTPTNYSAGTQSLFTGNIKWNNHFQWSKTLSGQISAWYLAPELIPQGKINSRYSIDFGIKKKIQKGKGELLFNATDIFNTLVIRSEINGKTVSFNSSNYAETQVFRFGYTYSF